jgi:hypothetical protein
MIHYKTFISPFKLSIIIEHDQLVKTLVELREEQKDYEKKSPSWYAFEGQILLISSMIRNLNKDWEDKFNKG